MPTGFDIDVTRRLVLCRCWGVLTSREIVAHYRELRAHPRFDREFSQLADLRDVTTFEVDSRAISSEALLETFSHTARRALIAASDVGFGLARMYASYADSASQNVQVFRTQQDAEEWLGLRERRIDGTRAHDVATAPDDTLRP